jgi:hypothetical protein
MLILLLSLICGYEWDSNYTQFVWRPETAVMENGDTVKILNPKQTVSISDYREMQLRNKAEDLIKSDSTLRDALLTETSKRMLLNIDLRTQQLRIDELEENVQSLERMNSDHNIFIAAGTVQTIAIILLSIKVFSIK